MTSPCPFTLGVKVFASGESRRSLIIKRGPEDAANAAFLDGLMINRVKDVQQHAHL